MFENEWALFIGMTFYARCVGSDGEFRLFCFESAMGVVAVAAVHRPFHHFVAERFVELCLDLIVAGKTKLRLAVAKQLYLSATRILHGSSRRERR